MRVKVRLDEQLCIKAYSCNDVEFTLHFYSVLDLCLKKLLGLDFAFESICLSCGALVKVTECGV